VANPFAAFAPTLEPVAVAVQEAAMRSSGSSDGSSAPYALRAAIRLGERPAQLAAAAGGRCSQHAAHVLPTPRAFCCCRATAAAAAAAAAAAVQASRSRWRAWRWCCPTWPSWSGSLARCSR
jgi:hypothetical protein